MNPFLGKNKEVSSWQYRKKSVKSKVAKGHTGQRVTVIHITNSGEEANYPRRDLNGVLSQSVKTRLFTERSVKITTRE